MLLKKFLSKKVPPPLELYYNGVARTANAGTTTVDANIKADLVISKRRTGIAGNAIFDRVRGALKRLTSANTGIEQTDTNSLTAFTARGFTLGADSSLSINAPAGTPIMHWCFKQSPGYFAIAAYTGNGEFKQPVAHSLAAVPELVIGKALDVVQDWPVLVSAMDKDLFFNTSAAGTKTSGNFASFGGTMPAGTWDQVAGGGGHYVICQKSGSTPNYVNVSDDGRTWTSYQVAGMPATGSSAGSVSVVYSTFLSKFVLLGFTASYTSPDGKTWTKGPDFPVALTAVVEQCIASSSQAIVVLAGNRNIMRSTDGLTWTTYVNALTEPQNCISGSTGTTFATMPVFGYTKAQYSDDGITWGTNTPPSARHSWRHIASGEGVFIASGLGGAAPPADQTNVLMRSLDNGRTWSSMTVATIQSWGGVAYGDGVWLIGGASSNAQGGVPSNIVNVSFDNGNTWAAKSLTTAAYWMYWAYDSIAGFVGASYAVSSDAFQNVQVSKGSAYYANPQIATVDAGKSVNVLDKHYITYMWASKPGVSKVGTYTGTGGTQNIPCGFAVGARFVMIKNTTYATNWMVWDSVRGINLGIADPLIYLNASDPEITNDNSVEPLIGGFKVSQNNTTNLSVAGHEYVYLAIA